MPSSRLTATYSGSVRAEGLTSRHAPGFRPSSGSTSITRSVTSVKPYTVENAFCNTSSVRLFPLCHKHQQGFSLFIYTALVIVSFAPRNLCTVLSILFILHFRHPYSSNRLCCSSPPTFCLKGDYDGPRCAGTSFSRRSFTVTGPAAWSSLLQEL